MGHAKNHKVLIWNLAYVKQMKLIYCMIQNMPQSECSRFMFAMIDKHLNGITAKM